MSASKWKLVYFYLTFTNNTKLKNTTQINGGGGWENKLYPVAIIVKYDKHRVPDCPQQVLTRAKIITLYYLMSTERKRKKPHTPHKKL